MKKLFWWFIVLVKLLACYFRGLENFLKFIGVYSPGKMNEIAYAACITKSHIDCIRPYVKSITGKVILEFGPGDSILSALVAHAYGFKESILVDIEPLNEKLIKDNLNNYDNLLRLIDIDVKKAKPIESLEYKYLDSGLKSLHEIPDASIDIIWSHVVLQHVYRNEVDAILTEFNRILKPDGMMSHKIDLKDCICGSLNNLRFSPKIWDTKTVYRSGFYTNRLRADDWLRLLEKFNFISIEVDKTYFPKMPIKYSKLSRHFKMNYTMEQLMVSGLHVISRRKKN
jgi:ubiquinone/menaquinone biosynthesis C-methylase UbiE